MIDISLPSAGPRPESTRPRAPALRGIVAGFCVVLTLAGCSTGPAGQDIWDPYENSNRRIHEANKAVDQAIFGGAEDGPGLPVTLRTGASNFAENLALPRDMINGLLQGRIDAVVQNGFRLVLNTTMGLGGLFDPATSIGVAGRPTDFGETLHVWGAPEGAYLELPILGPSTQRDAFGAIVDVLINPLGHGKLKTRERNTALGARLLARVAERTEYSALIESTLYKSSDSYAKARLLYLHNRRFELGVTNDDELFDPYEELYGQ